MNSNDLAKQALSQEQLDQQKKAFQEQLFNDPTHVFAQHAEMVKQQVMSQLAPQTESTLRLLVENNPKYSALYAIPNCKKHIDSCIQAQAAQGFCNPQALFSTLDALLEIRGESVEATKEEKHVTEEHKAPTGLEVALGVGHATDLIQKAIDMAKVSRSNPAAYRKWINSPEGIEAQRQALAKKD